MTIDGAAVRDAIWGWTKRATGLADGSILFAEQVEARTIVPPEGLWISIRVQGLTEQGGASTRATRNDDAFTAITVDPVTDQAHAVAHGFTTGDGPFLVDAVTAQPGGLPLLTQVYLVRVDADHFRFATSYANAIAGTPVTIDVTSAGTGAVTIVPCLADVLYTTSGAWTGAVEWRAFGGDLGEAMDVLQKVAGRRRAAATRAELRAANVGVGRLTSVVGRDGYVGAARTFEPRAELGATLHLCNTDAETGTRIQRVRVENQLDGETRTITGPTLT